jgi:hypothetical protein
VRENDKLMRQDRRVENQEMYRRANERLESAVEEMVSDEDRIPFVCECADDDCLGRVELTLAEYSAVRSSDNRFFILPGHLMATGEEVVEEHDGFQVTEK